MRAITLWQPWATLIAIGAKKIETRSWRNSYRGPLAIHAGKTVDPEGMRNPHIRAALAKAEATVPISAVVALVDLVSWTQFDFGFDPGEPERHFGNFAFGRWGLFLGNIRRIPGIGCNGARGLWIVEDDLRRQINAAIGEPFEETVRGSKAPLLPYWDNI